jgi:hypothetical protein
LLLEEEVVVVRTRHLAELAAAVVLAVMWSVRQMFQPASLTAFQSAPVVAPAVFQITAGMVGILLFLGPVYRQSPRLVVAVVDRITVLVIPAGLAVAVDRKAAVVAE